MRQHNDSEEAKVEGQQTVGTDGFFEDSAFGASSPLPVIKEETGDEEEDGEGVLEAKLMDGAEEGQQQKQLLKAGVVMIEDYMAPGPKSAAEHQERRNCDIDRPALTAAAVAAVQSESVDGLHLVEDFIRHAPYEGTIKHSETPDLGNLDLPPPPFAAPSRVSMNLERGDTSPLPMRSHSNMTKDE